MTRGPSSSLAGLFRYSPACQATAKQAAVLLLCISGTLAGCGADSNRPAGRGQAIARVNDTEITVHQINNELMFIDVEDEANLPPAEEILDLIVDRELLLQRAKALELERTPATTLAVSRARDQLLASAYLEQVMGSAADPTAEEVTNYYKSNPLLFAKRQRYEFVQLAVSTSGLRERQSGLDELNERLAQASDLLDFLGWLNEGGFSFYMARLNETADNLPPGVVEVLADMSAGELSRLESDDEIVILELIRATPEPIDRKDATAQIRAELMDRARMQIAETELVNLRRRANIEIFDTSALPADKTVAVDEEIASTRPN